MTDLPDRRLLLVHAHPDDESINNGATMAKYAADGGYGHPDHIQAHRVAMRAAELAAEAAFRPDLGDTWQIAKIYWNRVPRTVAEDGFARLREALGELPFAKPATLDDVPGVVD